MIAAPFQIFAPYINRLQVMLLEKLDNVSTDELIAKKIGSQNIASLTQVHGNRTIIVREPQRRAEEADGMWTDVPGLTLTIRVADCQSFVAYAPEKNIIGVLHAGWKGLVAGAVPSFIQAARDAWDIDPAELLIGAGPSLCMECAEFTDPVAEMPNIDPFFFIDRHVALCSLANDQFVKAGVRQEHIERHPDCTKCKNEQWWSYRGGDRGAVQSGFTNMACVKLIA